MQSKTTRDIMEIYVSMHKVRFLKAFEERKCFFAEFSVNNFPKGLQMAKYSGIMFTL